MPPKRGTRDETSRSPIAGVAVLDLVYVLSIVALFALVGLIAQGVERL